MPYPSHRKDSKKLSIPSVTHTIQSFSSFLLCLSTTGTTGRSFQSKDPKFLANLVQPIASALPFPNFLFT